MVKRYSILFVLLLSLVIGGIIGFSYWKSSFLKGSEEQEITILLESMKEVTKLITIEAEFSEIFKHEEYYGLDWAPFKKKALIRVQSKVLVGTDFTHTKFIFDMDHRIIQISSLPPSEILAIDNMLDYYDIQQGTFNPFTAKDYNELNRKAREAIRVKVLESDLIRRSDDRRDQVLQSFAQIAKEMGWALQVLTDRTDPMPD